MRFFEKARPEVFIHSVKLRRDKKTGRRLWQFTLIVTLTAALTESCDVSIAKAWEYITGKDCAAVDVLLCSEVLGCSIDFFAQIDDVPPALHLERVDLKGLRLTRDSTTVEFWFSGEHENSGVLHAFMKEYAYTRCWAQFSPSQGELEMATAALKVAEDPEFLAAADRLAQSVRIGEVTSLTIQTEGMAPVVIDKAAAERIHARAKAVKSKGTSA